MSKPSQGLYQFSEIGLHRSLYNGERPISSSVSFRNQQVVNKPLYLEEKQV